MSWQVPQRWPTSPCDMGRGGSKPRGVRPRRGVVTGHEQKTPLHIKMLPEIG